MSSPARTWGTVGALAVALAAVTTAVARHWAPLVALDAAAVVAARAALVGHAVLVLVTIAVTDLGSPVTVDAITAVVVVGLLLRRHVRTALYLLLVRLVALGAETALKVGLARPRPDVAPLTTASGFSFPSGHTTGTTALCLSLLVVAVPVLHGLRRGVVVAVGALFPLAVAASRVLLGVHYPSDVAGGLLTGALAALVLTALLPARTKGDAP
jgi:undecaprenyl-diphosphatase